MFKYSARHVIGLVLICASLILGVWIYYPLKEHEQVTHIPGIGEQRLIWTPIIRLGEETNIRLELSSVDVQEGLIPFLDDQKEGFDSAEDIVLGETHHLIIESRIDIPGSRILPNEEISQPLNQREKLIFIWQVAPVNRENISGEVWLYIHLVPLESGSDIRSPVLIRGITIQTIDLLGINTRTAKILMILGVGLGFILWLDKVGKIIQVHINRKQ